MALEWARLECISALPLINPVTTDMSMPVSHGADTIPYSLSEDSVKGMYKISSAHDRRSKKKRHFPSPLPAPPSSPVICPDPLTLRFSRDTPIAPASVSPLSFLPLQSCTHLPVSPCCFAWLEYVRMFFIYWYLLCSRYYYGISSSWPESASEECDTLALELMKWSSEKWYKLARPGLFLKGESQSKQF